MTRGADWEPTPIPGSVADKLSNLDARQRAIFNAHMARSRRWKYFIFGAIILGIVFATIGHMTDKAPTEDQWCYNATTHSAPACGQ